MSRRLGRREVDTCRDFVLPRLAEAGWTVDMIRPEYPVAADRVALGDGVVRDLGDGRVDYVLEAVAGVPVAVVEAKREYEQPELGLQQAIRYAQQLDVPIAYATNGHSIVQRDLTTGKEQRVESVATPAELWSAWVDHHGVESEGAHLLAQPFNRKRTSVAGEVITPRWYQTVAVHRALRAMAAGRSRVLLLMATGTGKTFTAMQVVSKLRTYHAARFPERNYRVLYLADLDVLLSQPMRKDFIPAFGGEPVHRVKGGLVLSREIYFASYQAMTGTGDTEALFHDYPRDFFDLVIVDECHRGSAAENSTWRRILDHFASAVQLGLTATPKRDATVDSYEYFGNPVFAYSLRQGIADGYLAPYRVRRIVLSPDAEGWSPSPGERDRFGREIPEGVYSTRDYERVLSLVMRTRLAAHHLSKTLQRDPRARTMVFCVDQQHAEDMRAALVAENPDLVTADPEWVVRIVGDEPERVRLLEAFMDPEAISPIVATTSRLLSTGVDVEDLKYVVLFRPIGSMVEFKQIIGRGTRLYPDKGKTSFEIIDYVGATALFNDPSFDGFPTRVDVEFIDDTGDVIAADPSSEGAHAAEPFAATVAEPMPGFDVHNPEEEPDAGPHPHKLFVDGGDFRIVAEAVQVPDTSTGHLRLTEYGEYVRGAVRTIAGSAGDLTARWAHAPSREVVIAELRTRDIELSDLVGDDMLGTCDPLDILLQLVWNVPAQTRSERARRARAAHANEIARLSAKAQDVLNALLDRYSAHGVDEITSGEVLMVEPLRSLGSPLDIATEFGGAEGWHNQVEQIQRWLYSA